MHITSILLFIAPLSQLASAFPVLDVRSEGIIPRDLAHPAPGANVLVPIKRRSAQPQPINLPSHGSSLHRRVNLKLPKKKGDKDKDDDDTPPNGGSTKTPEEKAAREALKKKKAAEKAEKAAAKAKKEKENADKKASMTEEEKKQAEADLAAQKERDRKRNEENKKEAAKFEIKPSDYDGAWKEFTKSDKGSDGAGWVDVDKITAAFKKCVPKDKFLFWTAAGNPAFEKAIPGYASANNMMQIATAASTAECKAAGLSGMGRPRLNEFLRTYIQERIMEDERKKGPNGKTGIPKPSKLQNEQMKAKISYDYYWPVMSTGYAKAASGKVVYVRPDNAVENPSSHWKKYEYPNLKKNGDVTEIREVTFDVGTTLDIDALKTMTPKLDHLLSK